MNTPHLKKNGAGQILGSAMAQTMGIYQVLERILESEYQACATFDPKTLAATNQEKIACIRRLERAVRRVKVQLKAMIPENGSRPLETLTCAVPLLAVSDREKARLMPLAEHLDEMDQNVKEKAGRNMTQLKSVLYRLPIFFKYSGRPEPGTYQRSRI